MMMKKKKEEEEEVENWLHKIENRQAIEYLVNRKLFGMIAKMFENPVLFLP